jgi:hypothetical protein
MIAPIHKLRVSWSKDGTRQPQEGHHLMAVLVVILALVNVSATVLMIGSWASMNTGMLELEGNIQDHLTDIVD